MQKSPIKIVELCVYVLIIIFASIWLIMKGSIYELPYQPTIITPTHVPVTESEPLPAVLPKGEVFPEQQGLKK